MDPRIIAMGELVSQRLLRVAAERKPDVLYDSVRYILAGGGKRLRPVLLLITAKMYGANESRAMEAALAIEVAHNWTLVHDDIMDDSPMRRGRETVHVRWDADTALLCGDALVGLAYMQLSRAQAGPELLQAFTDAALAVCEGQSLDMQFESRSEVCMTEYLQMIDLKTGAFLGASLEMGAILGEATIEECAAAREAGILLGRAFQIQDDLLDLVAEDQRWGKIAGSDLVEGKKTFLITEAIGRAEHGDREFFRRVAKGVPRGSADIDEARQRMERLGVLDHARDSVDHYTDLAITRARKLPNSEELLVPLMRIMAARVH